MKPQERKSNWKFISVVVFTTILLILALTLFFLNNMTLKNELIESEEDRLVESYNNTLNMYFDKLDHIEIFYRTIGQDNLNETIFNEFGLSCELGGIGFISFSIAPDGVMEYYFSYDYGDALLGLDLINDDRDFVRDAVEYAIENRVIVINGPFTLLQGGNGLVFRKAAFVDDDFIGIINLVVEYETLNQLLNTSFSEIVDVGVFDKDNQLIFGNLEYSDNLDLSHRIKADSTDWRIGVEVSSLYIQRNIRTSVLVIFIVFALYITALITSFRLYNRVRNLLVEKDNLIFYDNLTLLPNRRLLIRDINQCIKEDIGFYLGFGDLDNFKNLNDLMGHSIGDQYLKFIAERFENIISSEIYIYRWGGDEFIFLIKKTTQDEVVKSINLIYDQFKEPITIKDTDYSVSMSIGLVSYPENGNSVDSLIRRADIVMYDVKSQSNNNYGFFEDKYLANLQNKVDFENKVNRHSMEDFQVYLQPIVETDSGKIFGFEGLIRLFDENTLLNTYEVVKYYERKGEISKIDKFVFEKVCEYHARFKEIYNQEYSFSFNISPITLNNDFIIFAQNLLKKYNIESKYIVIEIIETLGFKDMKDSLRLMNKLRLLGFNIAMDDFGMGYSSLSYITKLPLSLIKIDRAFINNYRTNEFDRLLIMTIRDISLSLNIDVVVEGIETEEQLDFIKTIKAKYYQGYLHSHPESIEQTIKLIDKYTQKEPTDK